MVPDLDQMVDVPLDNAHESSESGASNASVYDAPKPFPGLLAKMSQAFASYTIIFILFTAFQLFRSRDSVESIAADVKQTLTSNCHALEKTATALVSVPQVAARGVQQGLITALNTALGQMGNGLEAVLDGIIAIIEFVISIQTGTWRCFLNNLASAGIPFLSGVGGEGVQAIDALDKALVDLLALPLRGLGGVIRERMGNPQVTLVVNPSTISTQKVEFCQEALKLEVVDQLTLDFKRWILFGSIVLVVLALVATLCNMGLISFQFKRWQVHVDRMREHFVDMPKAVYTEKVMRVHTTGRLDDPSEKEIPYTEEYKLYTQRISYMACQPVLYRFVDDSSKKLFPDNKTRQNLYFWFMFYICNPPVLMCLLIGLLGIVLTFSQIALIEQVRSKYAPMLATAVDNLSGKIFNLVNDVMNTTSIAFATETNNQLAALETDLNTNVFGGIVNAASQVSSSLNTVQETLQQGVQRAFAQPFSGLVLAVLQCLLLNKIAMVESGLKWVQEHAHITLLRLENDVLVMDQADVDKFVSAAIDNMESDNSTGSNEGEQDDDGSNAFQLIGRAIDKVFTVYERELERGLPIFYALVGVWGVVVVMGLVGVGMQFVKYRKNTQDDWMTE